MCVAGREFRDDGNILFILSGFWLQGYVQFEKIHLIHIYRFQLPN